MNLRIACLLMVALAGCGEESGPEDTNDDSSFPEGFLWGTAVAGFQVDMGCPTLAPEACEDRNSDWYQYITDETLQQDATVGITGDPPSSGPGHWELYEQDLDLAANELHNSGFRMSFEWSRIFPTATDGIEGYEALRAVANPEALERYHAILAAARARGLEPLVTLNHYTLPVWIHDTLGCHRNLDNCSPRGWLDKDRTVAEIAKYAGFCAQEFGAEVDLWATLNEPFAVWVPGYLLPSPERSNPPGVLFAQEAAAVVFVGLIEGHARMYDAVKAGDTADADADGTDSMVGVVYPLAPSKPRDPEDVLDQRAAENVFYLWNMAYLNAVILGDLDADLDGTGEYRDDLAGRMDYLGVNYYTRVTVHGLDSRLLPDLSPLSTFDPFTLQLWEDYPQGIYDMTQMITDLFHLPMIITENGIADPADDGTAPSYLVRHLTWLKRSIDEGADVRGYFYWSLIDNYEWNHGMDIRMGLYAVGEDDPAKVRTARQTVSVYGEIAEAHSLPEHLTAEYPVEVLP